MHILEFRLSTFSLITMNSVFSGMILIAICALTINARIESLFGCLTVMPVAKLHNGGWDMRDETKKSSAEYVRTTYKKTISSQHNSSISILISWFDLNSTSAQLYRLIENLRR